MSEKAPNPRAGSAARDPFTTTRRGNISIRRAATSTRLQREARQKRIAYLALFVVIALVVVVLVAGGLAEYVIGPAQSVATVNGQGIRNDTFGRYQKFEQYLLTNQALQLQTEISKLQADTKHAAANQSIIQQFQTQLQTVQSNQTNLQAYTLQQMENTLEMVQASAKIGAAPTSTQLDAELATLRTQAGGPTGFANLLKATGVQVSDLRTYFAAASVVQNNVTKHFEGTVAPTQPQAKARHILVKTKALALQIAQAVRAGGGFASLARKYSIDNGGLPKPGIPAKGKPTSAELQSSAYNGGWLRDPSVGFVANQPSWLTQQTSFVPQVLNPVLAMKAGEVRVVQSSFGWHVIQVTARSIHRLSKAEIASQRQQQGATGYQQWQATATDATKNNVNPSSPYLQFPAPTAVGQ